MLWLDGDLTACAFEERREMLDGLALSGPAWCTSPSYPGDGPELFAACTRLGLEGVVAKRLEGRYYPGQRRDVWVKGVRLTRRARSVAAQTPVAGIAAVRYKIIGTESAPGI